MIDVPPVMSRFLNAFNPYMRMLRGAEAQTAETKELMALRVRGNDDVAIANRKRVEDFIEKENK